MKKISINKNSFASVCVHYIIRIYFRFTWRLCVHVFLISKTFKTKLISPAIERPDCGDIISCKTN